jgi:NADH-quinone oxidoreductase subunit L
MPFGLLWLAPALPFAGFLMLIAFGARLPRRVTAVIGAGSVGLASALAIVLGIAFLAAPPPESAFEQMLWTWMRVADFAPGITLRLDALSLVMMLVVTFVGFLIHVYSTGFMAGEEGYHRFFAYMNLFVGSMLILVLANNLLLLLLGWEGVGLCSFLLIGFWYREPANGRAAMKAFIVTRVGDAAFAVGLFLLFAHFGTLNIGEILAQAPALWAVGSGVAVAAAALLLAGAVGKSAQLPLQVWLPDAMAGPSPVSALIHAATMVTAGVYLIARMHTIFELAPAVQTLVAIIGTVTLVLAGFSALAQWDLKRVLAYSTISQIGYMFLALGVGAWGAAIFHFMTHAFFKALLFLAAGAVILAAHHAHDMREMGGLRTKMPLIYWTFLIGALSLTALPPITAGFYSKDLILIQAWAAERGSPWLWAGGLIGVILTSLYTFRMVFYVFFGESRREPVAITDRAMMVPLAVLAFFSVVAGFVEIPRLMGDRPWFTHFLQTVFPPAPTEHLSFLTEIGLMLTSVAAAIAGIALAYRLFVRARPTTERFLLLPAMSSLMSFWREGWGFDRLYDLLFIRPYHWFAHANRHDAVDLIYTSIGTLSTQLYRGLSAAENGRMRWYAAGITAGAIIMIALMVSLWLWSG